MKTIYERVKKLEAQQLGTDIILILTIIVLGLMISLMNQRIIELETIPTLANYNLYDTIIEEEKEKEKGVEEEKYPITENERELITRIVAAESRGEPLEGQIAVAQVILDRWIDKGGSLNEILLAPKQFANPYTGDLSKYPNSRLATHLVFDLGFRIFEEPTFFFFNAKHSEPSQVELLRTYTLRGFIGNHEFRGVD